MLEIDEVKAGLRGELSPETVAALLKQRRLERQRYAALQPPGAFVGERPVYEQPLLEQGTVLRGLPSSPGRVTGTARVVRLPQDGARLQAGEILVAPSTDPGWTPLFLLAAGLVMETGGYLSHGALWRGNTASRRFSICRWRHSVFPMAARSCSMGARARCRLCHLSGQKHRLGEVKVHLLLLDAPPGLTLPGLSSPQ